MNIYMLLVLTFHTSCTKQLPCKTALISCKSNHHLATKTIYGLFFRLTQISLEAEKEKFRSVRRPHKCSGRIDFLLLRVFILMTVIAFCLRLGNDTDCHKKVVFA